MEIAMKGIFIWGVLASIIWVLVACSDKLDVKQEYDYTFSTWYLPKTVRMGEAVEIRFTLERSGNYEDAAYYISYTQIEGEGVVFDQNGFLLVNRETHALEDMAALDKSNSQKWIFTLFYRPMAGNKSEVRFVIIDNFGQEKQLSVSFTVKENE